MKVRNNYGMSETIRETRYECVERGKRGTLKKEKEKEKEKEREREKKKKTLNINVVNEGKDDNENYTRQNTRH